LLWLSGIALIALFVKVLDRILTEIAYQIGVALHVAWVIVLIALGSTDKRLKVPSVAHGISGRGFTTTAALENASIAACDVGIQLLKQADRTSQTRLR
jgi:hypothetical protein